MVVSASVGTTHEAMSTPTAVRPVPMTSVMDRHDRTVCSRSSRSRSTCSMSESVTPDAASTPSGPMMAYNDA